MGGGNRASEPWQLGFGGTVIAQAVRRLLERQFAQLQLGVLLHEIAQGPVVGEERHGLVELVRAEADPGRDDGVGRDT